MSVRPIGRTLEVLDDFLHSFTADAAWIGIDRKKDWPAQRHPYTARLSVGYGRIVLPAFIPPGHGSSTALLAGSLGPGCAWFIAAAFIEETDPVAGRGVGFDGCLGWVHLWPCVTIVEAESVCCFLVFLRFVSRTSGACADSHNIGAAIGDGVSGPWSSARS